MIGGLPGQGKIIVERTSDLIDWRPIQTNTITGQTFEWVERIHPGGPSQFYRALIRRHQ